MRQQNEWTQIQVCIQPYLLIKASEKKLLHVAADSLGVQSCPFTLTPQKTSVYL